MQTRFHPVNVAAAWHTRARSFFARRVLVVLQGLLYGFSFTASAVASGPQQPLLLEWQDLVPQGWEPPIIAPAYDAAAARTVDAAALAQKLGGELVQLPGYMKPVVFHDRTVSEFLLVPYLPQHVTQHAHLEPNQMVYVTLEEGFAVENPFKPVWVTGRLQLETRQTDEGPAGYSMVAASVTEYQ
jgi:hypothetical protein